MPLHPFEVQKCLITDEILDNIVHYTNQDILLTQPNFRDDSDVKLTTHKTEIKAFIGILCLAGALRSNKQSLEKLCGTDRNGNEKFQSVMNQGCLKFLIRCILELSRVVSIKIFTFL